MWRVVEFSGDNDMCLLFRTQNAFYTQNIYIWWSPLREMIGGVGGCVVRTLLTPVWGCGSEVRKMEHLKRKFAAHKKMPALPQPVLSSYCSTPKKLATVTRTLTPNALTWSNRSAGLNDNHTYQNMHNWPNHPVYIKLGAHGFASKWLRGTGRVQGPAHRSWWNGSCLYRFWNLKPTLYVIGWMQIGHFCFIV